METLLRIVEYLVVFCELFMCCVFCGNFFKKREKKNIEIIQVIVIGTIVIIFTILGKNDMVSQWYSIFFTICAVFVVKVFYKANFLKIVGATIVYACIVVICDAVIITSYALFSNQALNEITNTVGLYRLGASLLSKFLLTSIVLIMSGKRIKIISIENRYWAKLLVLANVMLIMAYFLVDLLIHNSSHKKIVTVIIIYYILMFIVITYIIYLSIKMTIHHEEKEQYKMIEVTNSVLEKALYNNENTLAQWKKAQHDYKNNLICMKELMKSKNFGGLENYIESLIQQTGEILYQYKTGNKIADILFNQKLAIARNLGIYVTVNVAFPENCGIDDTDICAIFGNALDNAIEGCKECERKQIRIIVKPIKGFLKIKIENMVKENPLDLNPSLFTSKKDKKSHGIGLKSIQQAIEKNGGFMELGYENNYFVFQGIIPIESESN